MTAVRVSNYVRKKIRRQTDDGETPDRCFTLTAMDKTNIVNNRLVE